MQSMDFLAHSQINFPTYLIPHTNTLKGNTQNEEEEQFTFFFYTEFSFFFNPFTNTV